MKKIFILLTLALSFVLVACGETLPNLDVEELDVPEVPAGLVQGVSTNEDGKVVIKVGNTASKTGGFAAVGIPFSAAIDSVFKSFNATSENYVIEYVTMDDGTDPAVGLTNVNKLIDEEKIFALVGHLGTGTVNATLPTLLEKHIPMVYAATGINELYFGETPGNPIFAVQPIYKTDGRIAYARAISESLFGPNGNEKLAENAKIHVLYTNEDAGKSITAGIIEEARNNNREGSLSVSAFEEDTIESAVQAAMNKKPDLIIVAGNQAPFNSALVALDDAGNEAPVITSYVNTNAASITARNYGFDFYGSAWLDIADPEGTLGFSAAYWEFFNTMTVNGYGATDAEGNPKPEGHTDNYTGNAFAMAGYVAAHVFLEGLDAHGLVTESNPLTFKSFITAMESKPLDIPMGGEIDFRGGARWGINSMALSKYTYNEETKAGAFVTVAPIESIQDILKK